MLGEGFTFLGRARRKTKTRQVKMHVILSHLPLQTPEGSAQAPKDEAVRGGIETQLLGTLPSNQTAWKVSQHAHSEDAGPIPVLLMNMYESPDVS